MGQDRQKRVAFAWVLVKESPGELRYDISGEGKACRSLSSLLVSMTVMYERVREEQTKPAMLWEWRTSLSPAPPGLPKSLWERGRFLKDRGPQCF